jgi:hypothetical protein
MAVPIVERSVAVASAPASAKESGPFVSASQIAS